VRLVSWNCRQGLHRPDKLLYLAGLRPDVAVLPEAAEPARTAGPLRKIGLDLIAWRGENPNKGLGLAVSTSINARSGAEKAIPEELFLHKQVHQDGQGEVLDVFGVWAFNHRAKSYGKGRKDNTLRALESMELSPAACAVVAGDFNDSIVWDKHSQYGGFSRVLGFLDQKGFVSAYHVFHGCEHGLEHDPTIKWSGGRRTYHIDFVFLPRNWMSFVRAVRVPPISEWDHVSDHAPVIVDIDLP